MINFKLFLEEKKEIKKFIPEETVIEIPMTYKLYITYFPYEQNINFRSLKITNIGLYSVAKPSLSEKICNIIIQNVDSTDVTITDALANVGGMTLVFAKYFRYVNACEIVKIQSEFLMNNLKIYHLQNKVNVINNDYINIMKILKQDIIFFDPPWGGKDYKMYNSIDLGINNVNIIDIINNLLVNTKYIFIRVPYNYKLCFFIKNINPKTYLKFYKINTYNKKFSQILIVLKTR